MSLAQDDSQKPPLPPIEVATNLVVVRAIFEGSRGKRITDLSTNDITVKDNGKTQKLLMLEAPSNRREGSGNPTVGPLATEPILPPGQSQEPLQVLILVPGMQWADRHYAVEAVAKYLESQHDGTTRVAVVDASGAALPFTSDADEMKDFARSLTKLSIPPLGFESWRFGQWAVRLCESMAQVPSKKAIVLLTDFLGTQPEELLPMALNIGAAVYTADARGVIAVTPLGDASSENVILDPTGQDFLLMDQQIRLTSISSQTGGAYVPGNDLGEVFKEVARDNSSSYVLGYYNSEMRHDGAFHSVKLTANRPGIHVRVRKGYFAPISGVHALDPNRQLGLALASDYPFRGVQIKFRPYFFPCSDPEERFFITIVSVGFRWASWTDESLQASLLSIAGVIRAKPDKVEDFSGEATPYRLGELGTPVRYYLESAIHSPALRLPSGATTIKVAARTSSGLLGNNLLRFTVPPQQTKGVRVSSLVITSEAQTVKPSDQLGGPLDPLLAEDLQIVPPASDQFQAGRDLLFFARILGATDATRFSANLTVKSLSRPIVVSQVSTDLKDSESNARLGVPVLFRLPASSFAYEDSPFVAVLTIKERGAKEGTTASAAFTISREME